MRSFNKLANLHRVFFKKVGADWSMPEQIGLSDWQKDQMVKDPTQKSWGAITDPVGHGRAHPGPMTDGPSWINGQVDRRIPGWNQKNVVESAPAVAHRGAMYPSPVQNQQNLSKTTTQYGSFPKK